MPAFTATDYGGGFLYNKKADAPAPDQKTARDEGATLPANFLKQQALSEKGERPVGIFKTNRLFFEGLLLSCELYRMVR